MTDNTGNLVSSVKMEDFEYSVEICDRDWDCFFAECEECNLLPPSIASLDDSGMSDFDNSRSVLAKRVQKVDLKASFSETDCLIDGPPDCEGSPVEHYLSKHGVSGMESVLSGSEEDLHLQSVNVFFEGLKNGTEAERPTEPSQVRIAQNSEEKQEEEKSSDGHHERRRALPKKSPKLNFLPASGETAVGKETTGPVETISSNTVKTRTKEQFSPNTFPEPGASNAIFFTNTSDHSEFFIRDKAGAVNKTNEETQKNQSNVSQDGDVCLETTTHIDKVEKLDVSTSQEDIMQEPRQFILNKKGSTDLWSNVDILTNVKWRDDQNPNVLQTDALSVNKTVSQESSPSASMKRKRRKKRRLSVEPAGSVHGYERQVLVKQSDSEEEYCLWRGGTGLCTSEGFNFSYLNQPQKMILPSLTPYSATSNLPIKISSNGITVNDFSHHIRPCVCQYQDLQESIARHASSMEKNAYNDKTVIPLCPNSTSMMTAQSISGNTATDLKLFCELQREDSAGLNKCPGLSVSITDLVTGTSSPVGSVWQDGEVTQSSVYHKNEQSPGLGGSEVKSVTNSILPSTESNDPAVDVCQNDNVSTAKTVLALEAGKCGRNEYTLCRREAEPQQQLEINCHFTDQYSCTMGETQSPLPVISTSSSDTHDSKQEPMKATACPSVKEISSQIDCDKITFDGSNSLSDECFVSTSALSLNGNMRMKHTNPPLGLTSKSKFSFLLDKETAAENTEITPQILSLHGGDPVPYGETNPKGKEETKLSTLEELEKSPFHVTPGSSCGKVDTESMVSLNTNAIDVSGGSPVSARHHDSVEEKTSLLLVKHETRNITCAPKSHSVLEDATGSNCDFEEEAEDAPTASIAECEPEKTPEHPVFAMSSFWNEMEKLTINDILGLRNISEVTPSSSLPPLQEIEETDMFAMTDSGFFNQLDESKPEQTIEDNYYNLNNAGLRSSSALEVHSSLPKTVLWENEHVTLITASDVYPKNKTLTSVSDIPEPVPPRSTQTCLRKISKNISVHNLPALESQPFSHRWKNQTFQISDKGQLEKVENLSNGNIKYQDKDCLAPSSSYKISLTDIFQYLFGEQKPIINQSATDNITSLYTDGNSVSENYDHFFSDFDTDSFFCPLITAEDQTKDKPVPIFSCSRSANRNIQYPEAYELFFASSSSDDSSDEEEQCGPVRVVTRFSRTPSSSRICKDAYENFFTDRDLKQNFFWKNAFSFRNRSFPVQNQTLSNLSSSEPRTQSRGPIQKTVHPVTALENQDIMVSDPLCYYLEDRISRQQAQMSFRCENLQMAVSSPRSDAPLLPLRHSDMCLLCIAFASWVMKTSDPQAGDAWKAVLLANVSALSAIRYLRKYVRMEATSSEKKVHCTTPSF